MAKTSSVTMSITVSGDGLGFTYVPPTAPVVNPASPGSEILTALAPGDNIITPPPNANYCLVVPAGTSTNPKKLKGVGGDTGVAIHPSNPTLVALPSGGGTFIINATAGETVTLGWG